MAFPVRIGVKDNIESASDFGPHLISGSWYVVNKEASGSCDVYKSTDNGVTWVGQDVLDLNAGEAFSVIWDLPNGLIYALRNKGVTTTSLLTIFDTATDLWRSIGADGPTLTPATLTDDFLARMVQVASGDIWVFYLRKISSSPLEVEIDYVVNSGGVWGTPGVLVAGTPGPLSSYLQAAIVDSNNLIHVFYKQNATNTENVGDLVHVSITTGASISSPTTISTVSNYTSAGHPSQLGTSILLPYFNSGRLAGVWAGTPLAVPVWTFTLVDTNSLGAGVIDDGFGSLQGTTAFSFVSSGVAYLLWQSTNDDGSYAINRIYYATNSGSGWSAPTLLYDEVLNPASWIGSNNPDLYAISANIFSGSLAVMSNVNCEGAAFVADFAPPVTTPFIPPFEDVLLFKKPWIEDPDNQFPWGALISNPIDLSCNNPCEAVVGVPYNHAFTASSGTPPYVYSLVSGALPDGLNLNTTTGVASGLPSLAGTFPFVIGATDALLESATVSCSIDVTDHVCPWQLCALFTTSPSCAMDGTVGLKRTADGEIGSSDAISSNPITVVAGQVYFIEFFLRGSGGADGTISVGYDFYDSTNTYLSSAYVTSTGSPVVFTSFTGTVTVPANAVTAVPVIVANNHLTGIWCIAALYSVLMDEYFILSSIRSYFTDYTAYR